MAAKTNAAENERAVFGGNSEAAARMRSIIERVERLEEEKAELSSDLKEVWAEAKGEGFDTKALKTIVKLRKKDQAQRQEEEAVLELYMTALGMA